MRCRISYADWSYDGRPGTNVVTDHYLIHTTITDREFLEALAKVMEGALQEYRRLAPGVPLSDRPLECYVFRDRAQWAKFTQASTGDDAAVYLRINRGGYTVRDWFATYLIGDAGTFAVASHEGWHQFVARHFRCRLPPFLDEGIASMLENITWTAGQPRWNLAVNPNRAEKLRYAIQTRQLWTLAELSRMHAGAVVDLSAERIETFYAQNWAFAQFACNAEGGRYRAGFEKMLAELASGEAQRRTRPGNGSSGAWSPRSSQVLLEHYFGMSIEQLDAAYQRYIRQIAFGTRTESGGN